jgi:hypothetical protein
MGFLRDLFGPSKEEIWEQLAQSIDGHFVAGDFWTYPKVRGFHGQWTVTLDSLHENKQTYTRLRAPYVNLNNFAFTIYRQGLFSELGKLLGMQDVIVGYERFDRDFIIQGNDQGWICDLFANARIRQLLDVQPEVYMTVKDDEGWFGAAFPEGVDELYFKAHGVIKNVERLRLLYELFAEVLDQLCRMGSAYKKDPGIVL